MVYCMIAIQLDRSIEVLLSDKANSCLNDKTLGSSQQEEAYNQFSTLQNIEYSIR